MAVTYNTAYNKITKNPPPSNIKKSYADWFSGSLSSFSNKPEPETITTINPQGTAGSAARAYQGEADSMFDSSVASASGGVGFAQQGIDAARSSLGNTNRAVGQMNLNAGIATDAARGMNTYIADTRNMAGATYLAGQGMAQDINSVRDQARLVNGTATSMLPYANTLRGYADTLWGQGNDLVGRGTGILNVGNDILNMNAGAGGIAGQYVGYLNALDPNARVSAAASDVQSAYGNAEGQMNRAMGRSGVSSGRSDALRQQFAQGLAAALAGAKTRARRQGLDDLGSALKDAMGVAQDMFTSGGNLVATGTQSQLGAAEAQKGAADVTATAGQLQVQSGQLHGQAGQLQASQAGVYADAGGLYGQAGNLTAAQSNAYTNAGQLYGQAGALSVNNAEALVRAYGNATSAQQALSDAQSRAGMYYAQVAQGYGTLAGVQNLFSGGSSAGTTGKGTVGGSPDLSKGIRVGGEVKPW